MYSGPLVFTQIMDFMPLKTFQRCVERYQGNFSIKHFTCMDQFRTMAFAQLAYRESLRDIEACLRAQSNKLYHMGIRGGVSRSTLAEANETRDWRIYADFAQELIQRARQLYAHEDFGVTLNQTAYAFDSTTVDLCLSLFPWAHFRRHKAAIKIHTLLDLRGNIPCFLRITSGKTHDVRILDELPLEPGSFYVMDRAYIDFRRLYTFTQQSAFFVTRAKSNLDYIRRSYRHVDKASGVKSDQTIALVGPKTSLEYPDSLRRISYFDSENKKRLAFLTNNFLLPPLTIAQLYRCRWQVELFFKWIKQHLRIKAFYGTSENAIKTQIWIAISIYVLVAILKKELKIKRNLNEILQIISITIFENRPIYQVLSDFCLKSKNQQPDNQLVLFDS